MVSYSAVSEAYGEHQRKLKSMAWFTTRAGFGGCVPVHQVGKIDDGS